MLLRTIARHVASIAALVLLGGLLSATLVRLAPGFDADERELDPGLSAESLRAVRAEHAAQHNILRFYAGYLRGALHGDLGTSQALGQPVTILLRERWPVTARVAGVGLLLGWLLAASAAFFACIWLRPLSDILGTTLSGVFLCIPAAVLALASVILNAPGYLAIALIVYPKIYRYSRKPAGESLCHAAMDVPDGPRTGVRRGPGEVVGASGDGCRLRPLRSRPNARGTGPVRHTGAPPRADGPGPARRPDVLCPKGAW